MPAPRTPVRPASSRATSAARSATRPVVSAREAQALREALALRQALAARPDLTPEQVAAARAAVAARKPTAAKRPAPKKRPAAARKRPAAKKRPSGTRPAGTRAAAARTGSSWSTRLGVVALSTLLLPAALALVLPGAGTPEDGPQDVTTLALTARSSLLEQADTYHQLEARAGQERTALQQARDAEGAARAAVAAQQHAVGTTAAALYRAPATSRFPVLGLSAGDPSSTPDVLFRAALADRAERAREEYVVRAERTVAALEAAQRRVADAEAAVAAAEAEVEAVLSAVRRQVDGLGTDVTGVLAGLGPIPAAGEQQARNQAAVQRWQQYLAGLTAAGIEPPAAAELTDLADLPAGLSPALDAAGQPIPGVAWAVIGSSPVTVLPAETVAAVSNAFSQLGKPFVAGTAGPETYDCGGFTAASWLLAGYALPATPQEQWTSGAPVPVDRLQVGDLVFSPGGQDVGLYLGDGDVLGASAATYQVGVRSMAADSTAVRVPLAAPAEPNAALAVGETTGPCGAPLPQPGIASPEWGGWSNGRIPVQALCQLGVYQHALRCDAAAGYAQMSDAFQAQFGTPLCITDSYRSVGSQMAAFRAKPKLAAVPGTSNHGWALAVDLCGGINIAGTPQWTWMTANAGRFGFVQPAWAAPGGEKPEPWHWEYGYIS
ncbi:NlpC/P60 family protein [Blastococcus sp. TF02A-30]|uniref:NlpC/P60 family protein n=1 Tax=Blastococcus sp. TF02A-30 TaxID=2250580 RepID=UPI000DEBF590|nr:NlpC/P60 family protein [Blastococcus sp. TF02A-30]RBY89526.1 hydrolase [Blastococcus sp. TF02A-30]